MLRPYTENLPARLRLLIKYLMYPKTNWVSRDKSRLVRMLLQGTSDRPVRTLDCGCGNAYFTHQATLRGARCLGITIHDWERDNCEEMREYLGIPKERMAFRTRSLDELASDPSYRGGFDQVLLLDVIEHIMDDRRTFRQIHGLLDEDGFVYITSSCESAETSRKNRSDPALSNTRTRTEAALYPVSAIIHHRSQSCRSASKSLRLR